MRNIKLVYQYDGSNFFGFQRQPNQRTIQGELERALELILKEKPNLISSGRTDRGVHAMMQVSNFFTSSSIPVERLERALGNAVVEDIALLSLEEVSRDFHSRFSAKERAYIYSLSHNKNIFERMFVTWVEEELNVERLQSILDPLVGVHNFDSFRQSNCSADNPVREIKEIRVYKDGQKVQVYIKGNAFLKSMIRIIMGSALAVYFGRQPENYILEKLQNPEKERRKIVAPPNGLYLCDIEY